MQFWCTAELEGGVRVCVKSGRVVVQWVCYCVTGTKCTSNIYSVECCFDNDNMSRHIQVFVNFLDLVILKYYRMSAPADASLDPSLLCRGGGGVQPAGDN